MFARFRNYNGIKNKHKRDPRFSGDENSREVILADLNIIAPGLSNRHLWQAEEQILRLGLDSLKLSELNAQQLLFTAGYSPAINVLEEMFLKVLGPINPEEPIDEKSKHVSSNSVAPEGFIAKTKSKAMHTIERLSSMRRSSVEAVVELTDQDQPTGAAAAPSVKVVRTVTLREYMTVWSMYHSINQGEDALLQQAFRFLDKDGNGLLSMQEFIEVMTGPLLGEHRLQLEECKEFVSIVDVNGDGVLQVEEFLSALHSKEGRDDEQPEASCKVEDYIDMVDDYRATPSQPPALKNNGKGKSNAKTDETLRL